MRSIAEMFRRAFGARRVRTPYFGKLTRTELYAIRVLLLVANYFAAFVQGFVGEAAHHQDASRCDKNSPNALDRVSFTPVFCTKGVQLQSWWPPRAIECLVLPFLICNIL